MIFSLLPVGIWKRFYNFSFIKQTDIKDYAITVLNK